MPPAGHGHASDITATGPGLQNVCIRESHTKQSCLLAFLYPYQSSQFSEELLLRPLLLVVLRNNCWWEWLFFSLTLKALNSCRINYHSGWVGVTGYTPRLGKELNVAAEFLPQLRDRRITQGNTSTQRRSHESVAFFRVS